MSIVEEDIGVGEIREFKLFIEPFTYSKDYNVSIGSKCRWVLYLIIGTI